MKFFEPTASMLTGASALGLGAATLMRRNRTVDEAKRPRILSDLKEDYRGSGAEAPPKSRAAESVEVQTSLSDAQSKCKEKGRGKRTQAERNHTQLTFTHGAVDEANSRAAAEAGTVKAAEAAAAAVDELGRMAQVAARAAEAGAKALHAAQTKAAALAACKEAAMLLEEAYPASEAQSDMRSQERRQGEGGASGQAHEASAEQTQTYDRRLMASLLQKENLARDPASGMYDIQRVVLEYRRTRSEAAVLLRDGENALAREQYEHALSVFAEMLELEDISAARRRVQQRRREKDLELVAHGLDLLRDAFKDEKEAFVFPSGDSKRAAAVSMASMCGRAHRRAKVNQDAVFESMMASSGIQVVGPVGTALPDNTDISNILNHMKGLEQTNVFCVLDGHGTHGAKVSAWLTRKMPAALEAALGASSRAVAGAIAGVFQRLDEDASTDLVEVDIRGRQVSCLERSGATATVALYKGGKLLLANVGDSRAILGGDGTVRVLTADHSPGDDAEKARIQQMGGEVKLLRNEPASASRFPQLIAREKLFRPAPRVFARGSWAPGLAVSRAFGDLHAKGLGVSCEPHVCVLSVSGLRKVLIMATDGVWDVLDDQTAVDLCMQCAAAGEGASAAGRLVAKARESWEKTVQGSTVAVDDISAVVVFLP